MRAITRPPRVTLANLETGAALECLFNPSQLTEKVQVTWSRLAVVGLGHQPLHYHGTANRQTPSVEFYLDKIASATQPGSSDILAFRDFLRAFTRPAGPGLEPPRMLLVWPSVLTLEAVVTELEFQYRQFGADGGLLVYTAVCTLEEVT